MSGRGGAELLRRAVTEFGAAGDPTSYLDTDVAMAFVATEGGTVSGWCYGYQLPRPDGTSMAYLHSIDVAERHRRQGLGRALLDAFLTEATRRGAAKAFLTTGSTNTPARALYESAGAEIAAQGPTENYWFDLTERPT